MRSLVEGDPGFDVAVIGAGVVGCAIARAFTLAGAKVVLLERGRDILSGASKGNSALLHTAFDAEPESLERRLVQRGRALYLEAAEGLGLPVLETGAVLVAWTEDEAARLPGIAARARANGVEDVRPLGTAELRDRVPALARRALAALEIPGEHAIDPWSAPLAYALQALANGATICREAEVTGGRLEDGGWRLETARGDLRADVVVNAAGLFGDAVERLAREPPFRIRPRKGQFLVYDKSAIALVPTIVLPVPDERTKGVLIAPTVFGNVLVGPTAEDQTDREAAAVERETLLALRERAVAMIPALREHGVTAVYAGLRPATEHKDYRIEAVAERRWITVAGIRSTGLTSALGIAEHVVDLYRRCLGGRHAPVAAPVLTPVPNLAEHRPRPYQGPGAGEIVCHCEWVTRAEIEGAVTGPLPARDPGGLKRRTRCMMGRCQGFYCAWRVAELTRGRVHWPALDRAAA